MDITVQMLGTGSAFAKTLYNTNALVTCNGFTLLIDCGTTAPRSLHELNRNPKQINAIYISHIHADHVGGLEEMGMRAKFELNYKPHLVLPSPLRYPIWNNCLRGGMEQDGLTEFEQFFDVTEIENNKATMIHPGFQLETIPLHHIPGKLCYGLVINDFMFYTSDTLFNRELIEHLVYKRNIQYILHDCQLSGTGYVHATLSELLTLPEDIQKHILLMHYSDGWRSFKGNTGSMTFIEQHRPYSFSRKAKAASG